jgi:zinc protease
MYQLLYGKHPYANPEIGNEQGVRAIKRRHLVEFHRDYYVASNMVIALVGDVDRKSAERIAEQISGRLPQGKPPPPLPEVPPSRAHREHIEFPSTQTHLLLGQRGIRRDDERYFALKVGNHGLGGGGFQSRLQHEIREKRGLSYDAYSYFQAMREAGPFLAGLSTANQQADQALAISQQVISDYLKDGPSEEEVMMAKKNITGGFPLSIDSNRELVATLAVIGFYRLPTDYLDSYIERVNAVTTEQVREAFTSLLSMDSMVTVSVGAGGNSN